MIWIGTSGWIYPHWVGRFYPPDLPVRKHLAYYAQYFVKRLSVDAAEGREAYVYFNNDPEGYAIFNAQQLQKLLRGLAIQSG